MKNLFTVGYEGSDIEDFVGTLLFAGIEALVDVRELPLSRKTGFSKKSLSQRVESVGIDYYHLRGLGDPKPGRTAAREGRYNDFKRIFSTHMKSDAAKMDLSASLAIADRQVACLLCFERDHSNCHRCIVAEQMVKRGGYRLVHIGVRKGMNDSNHMHSKAPNVVRHLELGNN